MGKVKDESGIEYPVDVKDLIPQKDPMRFVDKILGTEEKNAFISFTVPLESPFIDENGNLDEVIFMEMVAQSVAAHAGLSECTESGEPLKGFLLGCNNFVVNEVAKVGDRLIIKISKQASFGEFTIIDGEITRDGVLVAAGEIKIWREGEN